MALSALLNHQAGVIHILYARCKCSSAIVEHLAKRRRAFHEIVLVVGDLGESRSQLVRQGYAVTVLSAEALERDYSISSAPLLVVTGYDGTVRYRGGYRDSEFGPIRDEKIIANVLEGAATAALPRFGCAVSETLKRTIDPLGFKD